MPCRPPPPRKVLLACSTSSAISEGSGATESVPVSMRPASSRSPIRPRICLACSSITRRNSRSSAGSSVCEASSKVPIEPMMAASGVRSSWLTRPRNSVRIRSISSSGARSCMVTTTDSTSPSAAWIGVELMSVLTLRPSGTESTTSSARSVSPVPSCCAMGNSRKDTSRPSARRKDSTSRICSSGWPGVRSRSTMRRASRLNDTGWPLFASNTTTPTAVTKSISTAASGSSTLGSRRTSGSSTHAGRPLRLPSGSSRNRTAAENACLIVTRARGPRSDARLRACAFRL